MLDAQKLSHEKDERMKEGIYLSKAEHTLSGKIRRLNERVKKGVKINIAYEGKLKNELNKVIQKRMEVATEIRHITTMQSQFRKELAHKRLLEEFRKELTRRRR
jgi:uncharacterized protein YlxW (UPF0749 family)